MAKARAASEKHMSSNDPNPKWPGNLNEDTERLDRLKADVAKARSTGQAAHAPEFDPAKPTTGMGLGLKMGMDLTVATLIGFGLGALVDWPLGTFPLVALILCGLGFAAGIRMVLASATDYRSRLETGEVSGSSVDPKNKID